MGHLLMIESWVGAMSSLLPRAIREGGHRFSFLTRDLHHYLRSAPTNGVHPLLSADNVLTAETNDLPQMLGCVERLHTALKFDGVISSCDYYLATAARVAAHLGLPGAQPESVERACRKDLTRQALHTAGVPGPEFAVTGSAEEAAAAARRIGYPVVVKPVDLCAGMFVRAATNERELVEAVAAMEGFPVNARQQPRVPAVLVEEMLTGPEVSVETVTVDGATRVIGVTDKSITGFPWFVENGHMFPADLEEATASAAAQITVAAIEALGLADAVAHTEVKLTPQGPRIVEVNPRPAGNQITELIRRVTGINLPKAYVQLALGDKPDVEPVQTGVSSAAITFLVPPRAGQVDQIQGIDRLDGLPEVVEWKTKPPGHRTGKPTSNNNYLGHVMVIDSTGRRARHRAEELTASLTVSYRDEPAEILA